MTSPPPLLFGIYPLGVAGTPTGLAVGPPDDYDQIRAALDDLDLRASTRTYLVDTETGGQDAVLRLADRYREVGLLSHVTLGCLRDTGFELDRWIELVRTVIRRYGDQLRSLQITNEPNLSFMDGAKPYVLQALTHGVVAAKDEIRRGDLDIDVGFGSVPQSDVALTTFWADLAATASPALWESVDFVGHNFYVDVFEEPLETAAISTRVEQVLRALRHDHLAAAGIPPRVPIRVTENGWPTGTNPFTNTPRTPERQAEVIDTVIRTVHRLRSELNISHYMLFGLRDADSSQSDLFHQFGIMHDDYTPKPAYHTFKYLITELGSHESSLPLLTIFMSCTGRSPNTPDGSLGLGISGNGRARCLAAAL